MKYVVPEIISISKATACLADKRLIPDLNPTRACCEISLITGYSDRPFFPDTIDFTTGAGTMLSMLSDGEEVYNP